MDALTGTRNSIRGQLAAPCPSAKANPELGRAETTFLGFLAKEDYGMGEGGLLCNVGAWPAGWWH